MFRRKVNWGLAAAVLASFVIAIPEQEINKLSFGREVCNG
jgi:hypothetical protein